MNVSDINWGNGSVLLAAGFSLLSSAGYMFPKNKPAVRAAFVFYIISSLLVTASVVLLIYLQITHQFQFQYVYEHTSTSLNPVYLVSSLWAGQAGSLLLWAVINTWVGFIMSRQLNRLAQSPGSVMGGFSLINTGIILLAWLMHPFSRTLNRPGEGLGLNQALQDPWMVVHPPLVFVGYAAISAVFILALVKDLNPSLYLLLRKWTSTAWLFLGAGIVTGSIWAYYALGWGGYWAWDPIENAALVPWIILTAISHGNQHPDNFRVSNRVVYMLPLVLAVVGTFLARSGILKDSSAHAYTGGGLTIPLAIVLVVLILFTLFVVRRRGEGSSLNTADLSRPGIMTLLRLSFYGFAALVTIGTLLPLILGQTIDRSFFNAAAVIYAIATNTLMLLKFGSNLKANYASVLIIDTVIVVILSFAFMVDQIHWLILIWFFLILPTERVVSLIRNYKNLKGLRISKAGALIAHLGVILLFVGVLTSSGLTNDGMVLAGSPVVSIKGVTVDISITEQNKPTVIQEPRFDLILTRVNTGNYYGGEQGAIMIAYSIKPLIILFWTGCILILTGIASTFLTKVIETG